MNTYRLATAAIAVLVAAIGRADIAYNNFGSGDSFDGNNNYRIGGRDSDTWQAMSFVSGTSGAVSSIRLALIADNVYTVSIDADAGGLPGQMLESWNAGSSTNYFDVTGDGSASLAAGVRYWVEVQPYNVPVIGGWYFSNLAVGLGADAQDGGPPWYPYTGRLGVFRVETQSVPAPPSIVALTVGSILLVGKKRPRA